MRIGVLAAVVIVIALAAGAFWFYQVAHKTTETSTATEESALSGSTKAVLASLDSPTEIRFYSLLDPTSVPESTRAFSERVSRLLADYEQAADGKIKIVRFETNSDASAGTASADGIRAFNIDKGDACFLGIAITQGQKKEAIAQLSEQWEPALEFDLSRAIARVNQSSLQIAPMADGAPATIKAAEQLIRSNPNLVSASLQEGTEILRTAALADFKSVASDTEARLKEAEQRLLQAQSQESDADEKAAAAQLQQIRSEQTQKLKEIAARLQTQLALLQRAKTQAK